MFKKILRSYGLTLLRSYGLTLLRSCNLTLLRSYGLTLLRSYGLTVLLLAVSTSSTFAQRYPSEISVYGAGGFNIFVVQKPANKTSSAGYGIDAGVGYTYFFSENLGLHTSVGFGYFNTTNRLKSLSFVSPDQKNDCDDNIYDLYTTLNYYSENHKTMYLSVPLMLQYQTRMQPLSNRNRKNNAGFYAMAGAKALFMVNNEYTTEVVSLYNKSYYPQFNNWISDQPELGLGLFKGNRVTDKLAFKVLPIASLEAGIKWQFGKKVILYTGAYFDIGLYDYTKKQRVPYSNFTAQEHLAELSLLEFSNKMNLMAGGVKVRVAFLGTKSRKNDCCR